MEDEISVAEYLSAGFHSRVSICLSTIEGVAVLVTV